MNVGELIAFLRGYPSETEIILQKDAEGNGYSPLSEVDGNAVYIPESTWSGNVYSLEWSADDACMTDEEWAEINKKLHCVVLAPVN